MHINLKKGVFDRIKCANSAKCCTCYCGRSAKFINKEEMQFAFGNSLTLDSTKFAKYRQIWQYFSMFKYIYGYTNKYQCT